MKEGKKTPPKTPPKKVEKKEVKKAEEKKKTTKGTPSKKSSVASSKKGKSPSHSEDEIQIENIGTEIKEKSFDDQNKFIQFPMEPTIPKPQMARNCISHNQPLKYYCEACEEPTCADCHSLGPHNTELHRVASLYEAFNARYNYLCSGTYKNLLDKRDTLLAQLDRIDHRIGEINQLGGRVGLEVKAEYAGVLERLRSSEGAKIAVLQHEMADLQKDIDRIDSIFEALDDYLQGDLKGDYVGFLIKFRELHEYIEYSITKPFKVKVEVVPNDLPRELMEKRKILEQSQQSESLLKFKDEIIWNLIQEKKNVAKIADADIDKASQYEWNEWAKLINKYSNELQKYQLVCSYCGCVLEPDTVNTNCSQNFPEEPPSIFGGSMAQRNIFTAEGPSIEFKGTGKHFFAKPFAKPEVPNFSSSINERDLSSISKQLIQPSLATPIIQEENPVVKKLRLRIEERKVSKEEVKSIFDKYAKGGINECSSFY
jgi:palmitoyltransferase